MCASGATKATTAVHVVLVGAARPDIVGLRFYLYTDIAGSESESCREVTGAIGIMLRTLPVILTAMALRHTRPLARLVLYSSTTTMTVTTTVLVVAVNLLVLLLLVLVVVLLFN